MKINCIFLTLVIVFFSSCKERRKEGKDLKKEDLDISELKAYYFDNKQTLYNTKKYLHSVYLDSLNIFEDRVLNYWEFRKKTVISLDVKENKLIHVDSLLNKFLFDLNINGIKLKTSCEERKYSELEFSVFLKNRKNGSYYYLRNTKCIKEVKKDNSIYIEELDSDWYIIVIRD